MNFQFKINLFTITLNLLLIYLDVLSIGFFLIEFLQKENILKISGVIMTNIENTITTIAIIEKELFNLSLV